MSGFLLKTDVTVPGRGTMYVYRMPSTGLTVLTDVPATAKTFKTAKAADAFRTKHVECPHMFNAVVVSVESICVSA